MVTCNLCRVFVFAFLMLFASAQLLAEVKDVPVDFAIDVLPILSNKCFACHGPDSKEEDIVRLDSFLEATKDLGGHQAINPGSPSESELLVRINSEDDPMPPEDADKQLTKREREILNRWVSQGGQYASHWSFVPPVKVLPDNSKKIEQDKVIDAYIAAKLDKQSLTFAEEADRATLARRASLVLTGLPPSPDHLSAFLNDQSDSAYDKYIDQLLASSSFGEHQARYWLDAVRYGDTHGLHLDNRRGIYPYRDWVIQAFNQNLPLNDFIIWQLAGDLLDKPTLEQQVATGFVRMNPSTSEGGAIPAEFQAKNNFDRVETLGTVFLGMTLTCARCHTHKYDPITQQEYYELFAFFNSTAESAMDGNKYEYGPVIKAPSDLSAWDNWNKLLSEQDKVLENAESYLDKLNDDERNNWKTADKRKQLSLIAKSVKVYSENNLHQKAAQLLEKLQNAEKSFTTTLVAKELAKPRKTQILARGEYNLPVGEPLEPGVLAAISPLPEGVDRNRLGLAKWLTSRQNPLVSRVVINRIWQRTFGYGLVRTPEDFGLQGQQPTHPKLLDWLAVEFQESGWDIKHMLRLMVTSQAFRQSSAWRDDIIDPENLFLARGPSHRLDAEVIRDVALWSSRLLNQKMGGEGVKPYQPKGLWAALMHPASNTKLYVQDEDDKQYKRSVYLYWKRTSPHPVMTLFDAPSRESSCIQRSRTNTSLQSLGLFNEEQRIELARNLAERVLINSETSELRVSMLFRLLGSREPTEKELAACNQLLSSMKQRYSASKEDALKLLSIGDSPRSNKLDVAEHAAWTQLAITVLASDMAILLY